MSRIVGLPIGILALSLVLGCSIEPSDERPGLWLSGEVVAQPVSDWSFASDVKEIFIETATPYGIPHSVTIWCATLGNALYVGAYAADTKRWVANVRRNPNVRLKIAGKLYAQRLEPVTDAATIARLDHEYARKYGYDEEEDANQAATTAHWRVVERD